MLNKVKASIASAIVVITLGIAIAPALAETAAAPKTAESCFSAHDWDGWKAPNRDMIYIRVGLHDVYRVDLSGGSPRLQEPDVHLVSQFRGSDYVCSPLDLDLSVADTNGFREPLIVKAISKLTPDQIAAIPAKFKP